MKVYEMTNYLDGFKGETGASSIVIPADKTIRLPHQPCKFVMLSNWNVGDDTAFTAKAVAGSASLVEDDLQEFYYGFRGRLIAQLFSSRSTELLPVSNCNEICVRARPAASATVYYAWFL
jgi:hypothetical protein